jgi:hypothetical protein
VTRGHGSRRSGRRRLDQMSRFNLREQLLRKSTIAKPPRCCMPWCLLVLGSDLPQSRFVVAFYAVNTGDSRPMLAPVLEPPQINTRRHRAAVELHLYIKHQPHSVP